MTTISEIYDDPDEVMELLYEAATTEWEMDFADNLNEKFEDWGDDMFLSTRQADTIDRILADDAPPRRQ